MTPQCWARRKRALPGCWDLTSSTASTSTLTLHMAAALLGRLGSRLPEALARVMPWRSSSLANRASW
eukprot:8844119-Heterocapsa_arctica.AAC.1